MTSVDELMQRVIDACNSVKAEFISLAVRGNWQERACLCISDGGDLIDFEKKVAENEQNRHLQKMFLFVLNVFLVDFHRSLKKYDGVGCAIYDQLDNKSIQFHLKESATIYSAELLAVNEAIKYVRSCAAVVLLVHPSEISVHKFQARLAQHIKVPLTKLDLITLFKLAGEKALILYLQTDPEKVEESGVI
uniref:Uncharacterized protein n=1 Tax=Rhodnius prolixus TaxID=13249 RepID=T1HSF5_RHOPR